MFVHFLRGAAIQKERTAALMTVACRRLHSGDLPWLGLKAYGLIALHTQQVSLLQKLVSGRHAGSLQKVEA